MALIFCLADCRYVSLTNRTDLAHFYRGSSYTLLSFNSGPSQFDVKSYYNPYSNPFPYQIKPLFLRDELLDQLSSCQFLLSPKKH